MSRVIEKPEYRAWSDMRNRCTNSNNHAFAYYGGRGITTCQRWEDFSLFLEDMGPRPSPQHTIDRINNNGNYSPANCRWATRSEQARNRRGNLVLTYLGKTQCAADWADETGLNIGTLQSRIRYGWSDEKALTTPVRRGRNMRTNLYLTHGGKTLLLVEWADRFGINRSTLRTRVARGWSAARALLTPIQSKESPETQ